MKLIKIPNQVGFLSSGNQLGTFEMNILIALNLKIEKFPFSGKMFKCFDSFNSTLKCKKHAH